MLIATLKYKWQASIGSIILVAVIWALKPVLTNKETSSDTAK